jgi:hypothetical protein
VVEHWERIKVPALVIAGREDLMAAPPDAVAARLPNGRPLVVPGDHFSAFATPEFVEAILECGAPVPPIGATAYRFSQESVGGRWSFPRHSG